LIYIVCTGFWKCLSPSDWIQLASVIIAMLAAIASYITVNQQNKQFKVANEERKSRYKPYFKINLFNKTKPTQFIFDITNEGFPYFVTETVRWVGEGNISADFFNGDVGNELNGRHHSLVILLNFPEKVNGKGYFEVSGIDIDKNIINFKSPEIIFKEGNIENHIKVAHQYLK
jgi:hypothetical protein